MLFMTGNNDIPAFIEQRQRCYNTVFTHRISQCLLLVLGLSLTQFFSSETRYKLVVTFLKYLMILFSTSVREGKF